LEQDGAGVVAIVSEMDGAAGFGFTRGEHSFMDMSAMHSLAAELGEEGRVDIEDAAREIRGNGPERQKTGHQAQIDMILAENGGDFFRESVEGGKIFFNDDVDGKVETLGAEDSLAVGIADDDAGNAGGQFATVDGVGDILERGASAGEKDAERGHGRFREAVEVKESF
jgi:hypothetical protein